MEFNTQKGGAAGYLNAAKLAPSMDYGGTFDPVKQISQARQNASYMSRQGEMATGEILLGGMIGDEIRQVEKYKADLAKAGAMQEAQATTQQAWVGMAGDVLGGVSSFFPQGSPSGWTTGSTGGLGDTVRAGDVGKYGSFQDPTADINRAMDGKPWGVYPE